MVMGEDSHSRDYGFESQHQILDRYFIFVDFLLSKIVMFVTKKFQIEGSNGLFYV